MCIFRVFTNLIKVCSLGILVYAVGVFRPPHIHNIRVFANYLKFAYTVSFVFAVSGFTLSLAHVSNIGG